MEEQAAARCGRTQRITDPAPVMTDCKPQRFRGIQCIRLFGYHNVHISKISGQPLLELAAMARRAGNECNRSYGTRTR